MNIAHFTDFEDTASAEGKRDEESFYQAFPEHRPLCAGTSSFPGAMEAFGKQFCAELGIGPNGFAGSSTSPGPDLGPLAGGPFYDEHGNPGTRPPASFASAGGMPAIASVDSRSAFGFSGFLLCAVAAVCFLGGAALAALSRSGSGDTSAQQMSPAMPCGPIPRPSGSSVIVRREE
jgi:hypothetical protein